MQRVLSYTIVALFICATFLKWGVATARQSTLETNPKKELVDIKADIVFPYKVTPDSSVLCLVGNFAAQHNGAIITADSAVRYGDERIDCFGNVLINKNTTYAYADHAMYNGALNEVMLYSPIIKVIDEGVILYTYNFKFNTLDNIGEYWGGGVTTNKDSSRLESLRGYYYADNKNVIGVEQVEIYTTEYELQGDSVIYNMESGYAEFFENSNIWNTNGEYLYANLGDYDKELSRFSFTRDGYMLNQEQEAWSDSMEYFRERQEAILRSNIQMDDTTNKMLVYSDFAHYWGDNERLFLSKHPSIVNYDPEQADTLFMRADTIILTTHNRAAELRDSLTIYAPQQQEPEPQMSNTPPTQGEHKKEQRKEEKRDDRRDDKRDGGKRDNRREEHKVEPKDSLTQTTPSDSTTLQLPDSLPELSREEQKRLKSIAKRDRADSISLQRAILRTEKLNAQKLREERRAAERKAKLEARLLRRGVEVSCEDCDHDHGHQQDTLDSLTKELAAVVDSVIMVDSVDTPLKDSIYRIIVGFRGAKTLQGSQQSISDSMSMNMRDTTMHLYIAPYIWSGENQISSEIVDIYTRKGRIDSAHFTGNPIMASIIDTSHYNQVSGREMTAHFVDNEITRNEVVGNVRTIYYILDDQTQEVTTMTYVESGTATFYFVERELEGITYRAEPIYTFYPMAKIPTTQPTRLDGFVWEGRERPTRKDFTDRYRRPSIREQKEALPRPLFPIENTIRLERDTLVQDRIWMDRTEQVAPHAEEWLESLGYSSGQPRQ